MSRPGYKTKSDTMLLRRLINNLKERGSEVAGELERKAHNFLTDVQMKRKPVERAFESDDDSDWEDIPTPPVLPPSPRPPPILLPVIEPPKTPTPDPTPPETPPVVTAPPVIITPPPPVEIEPPEPEPEPEPEAEAKPKELLPNRQQIRTLTKDTPSLSADKPKLTPDCKLYWIQKHLEQEQEEEDERARKRKMSIISSGGGDNTNDDDERKQREEEERKLEESRLEEERKLREEAEKIKQYQEIKAKEEARRKAMEEEERRRKIEEERQRKLEEQRLKKEAAELAKKLEEERKRAEEEESKRLEKERKLKEEIRLKEEEERKKREEEELLKKQEEERRRLEEELRKQEEEERERQERELAEILRNQMTVEEPKKDESKDVKKKVKVTGQRSKKPTMAREWRKLKEKQKHEKDEKEHLTCEKMEVDTTPEVTPLPPRAKYVPPVFKENECYSDRHSTFLKGTDQGSWPHNNKKGIPTPSELAEAGFFFIGPGDYCRCYQCGLEQMCWEPFESPWIRHGFLAPDCCYVERIKGREWIEKVVQGDF